MGCATIHLIPCGSTVDIIDSLSVAEEDHENAARLASGLQSLGLNVLPAHTNIVFFDIEEAPGIVAKLASRGVRILCTDGKKRCRAVANLHTQASDIDYFLAELAEILGKLKK